MTVLPSIFAQLYTYFQYMFWGGFCQPFYCYPYRTTITYSSKKIVASCWKLVCVKRINAGVGKRFANYDAATMQL